MISIVTIFEEMQRDFISNPKAKLDFDYKIYARKIKKYGPTFEGIMSMFENDIFGELHARRNKGHFIDLMTFHGWKYFNLRNFNELFSIMIE